MNTNTNALAVFDNVNSTLSSIELSPVNTAILAKVPDNLKDTTAAIMRANQYSSGVSLVLCSLLFNLKSNSAALKASPYKNYSNYCKEVLRLDAAQASRYAVMFERLFYDVDKPIEKLTTDFTVAQLVAISLLKDRTIRTLFIDHVTADYPCTNINKAVSYLKDFNKQSLDNDVIDWKIVDDLLKFGKSEKIEKETTAETKTAETTAETTTAETTAETTTADNICKFTTIEEFEKWKKSNKKAVVSIVVTLAK
jgi:hypothetical protein